jgi:hypothetical protein
LLRVAFDTFIPKYSATFVANSGLAEPLKSLNVDIKIPWILIVAIVSKEYLMNIKLIYN